MKKWVVKRETTQRDISSLRFGDNSKDYAMIKTSHDVGLETAIK
jgi:hypothetical protein